jgi:hypothetical protein
MSKREQNIMGYPIKVQKVERPTNRSYYVNLPVVLAETLTIKKGEAWQWSVQDQDTLIFSRVKIKTPPAKSKK